MMRLQRSGFNHKCREGGSSLLVSLLMLVVVLLLGVAAARMALQSEKASRSDRDRQIAFQAAEAALMDAEMDIEKSPVSASRRAILSENPVIAYFIEGCGMDKEGDSHGLCKYSGSDKPVWLTVDFNATGVESRTVPFGKFTGQSMQTGSGMMPIKLPRYIIEPVVYRKQGGSASGDQYIYRVTAVGFGVSDTTQVALQSFYSKVDQ
jgi:type IV pilus assembly protein PilX